MWGLRVRCGLLIHATVVAGKGKRRWQPATRGGGSERRHATLERLVTCGGEEGGGGGEACVGVGKAACHFGFYRPGGVAAKAEAGTGGGDV